MPTDDHITNLTLDGMRTATALVAAQRRGDFEGMTRLWNDGTKAGPEYVVHALAAIPVIMVDQLGVTIGVTINWDHYLDHALKVLASAAAE